MRLREKGREQKEALSMENQQIKNELIQMQDLLKASEQEKLQLKYEVTKKETTVESS